MERLPDLDPTLDENDAARSERLTRMLCEAGCPEWAAFIARALAPSAATDVVGPGLLAEHPDYVASGMRHGRIAKPSWQEIESLYPAEAAEAKAQGVNAAADEMEAIYRREKDDAGLDLWDVAQIIRDTMSPKGWPALGIRARQLDWEAIDHLDGANGDTFVAFAHADSTGLTYDLSHEKRSGKYDVSLLEGMSFDSENEAKRAAQEHHERQLLRDLERDVMGGERTALRWFLHAWMGGQHVDLLPELAEILSEDSTPEKKAHHVVLTALRRVLAEGEGQ